MVEVEFNLSACYVLIYFNAHKLQTSLLCYWEHELGGRGNFKILKNLLLFVHNFYAYSQSSIVYILSTTTEICEFIHFMKRIYCSSKILEKSYNLYNYIILLVFNSLRLNILLESKYHLPFHRVGFDSVLPSTSSLIWFSPSRFVENVIVCSSELVSLFVMICYQGMV